MQYRLKNRKIKLFIEQRKPILEDWKHAFYLWKNTPLAMIGSIIIIIFFIIAIFAPLLTSYSPIAQNMNEKLLPPSSEHLFGTDQFGRDILARVIYGTKVAVWIVFVVSIISVMIGITVGITAGYFGGIVDEVLMRIADMF